MGDVFKLRWDPAPESGLSRRAQRGCGYEAYVPDLLAGRTFSFDGQTIADIVEAERAISTLNARGRVLADGEAIARLLLRAEAVASSRIEGLHVGGRRLLRAQLAGEENAGDGHAGAARPTDVTATEILNNIQAMRLAVDAVAARPRLTVDDLLQVHGRLLEGTSMAHHGGRLRTEQNWIGGSGFNPCSAAFVPPPPDTVEALLDDLCRFCNEDQLPAVAQAALAHSQFETIHPFVDGNGRTGRSLVHIVLRRRGVAPRIVPPISLVLATWSADYVEGLTRTRYLGAPEAPAAVEGTNRWVSLFAAACTRSVADAQGYEDRVREVQESWRDRLGTVRRGSGVERMLAVLPGAPIVTVRSAAALIDRTFQAANVAIARLVEAGILTQTTVGVRNRAFEATELLDSFNALERQLASPEADTASSPPSRPAPAHAYRGSVS